MLGLGTNTYLLKIMSSSNAGYGWGGFTKGDSIDLLLLQNKVKGSSIWFMMTLFLIKVKIFN